MAPWVLSEGHSSTSRDKTGPTLLPAQADQLTPPSLGLSFLFPCKLDNWCLPVQHPFLPVLVVTPQFFLGFPVQKATCTHRPLIKTI